MTNTEIAKPLIQKIVKVSVEELGSIEAYFLGIDESCHGGLGNIILQDINTFKLFIVRGESVVTIAR